MYKFDTNTLISNNIKNLLQSTPLPLYDTINEDRQMIEGAMYVYNQTLIKCIHSGSIDNEGVYQIIQEYLPNHDYLNVTHRFVSKSSYYDFETHRYLGEYLRYYRDYYKINLMPFYNCFTPQLIEYNLVKNTNTKYKTYITPIKFNQIYTLAIDCSSKFYFKPIIYNEYGVNDILDYPVTSTISTFNNRLTFKYITTNLDIYSKKHDLYVALSIPVTNTSSITILEGDYVKSDVYNIFNAENIDNIVPKDLNRLLVYNLSLLKMNINKYIPFSNKLVEYLLGNVVDKNELLTGNIQRLEQDLDPDAQIFHKYGIWNETIRAIIYRQIQENNYSELDCDGYIDKSIEKQIAQGTLKYNIGRLIYTGQYKIDFNQDTLNITSAENEQYDIVFVDTELTPIKNIIDPTNTAYDVKTKKLNMVSKSGQKDILIDGYVISDITSIIIDGKQLSKSSYELLDNKICLLNEANLWKDYMGGLNEGLSIEITFMYHVNSIVNQVLVITYQE